MSARLNIQNSLTIKVRVLFAVLVAAALMIGGLSAPSMLAKSKALDLAAVTTGPLWRIADWAGFHSISVPNVPVLGDINLALNYTGSDAVNLYNKINDYPFGGFLLGNYYRQPGGTLGTAILASSGIATPNAVKAYQALLASGAGNTPAGYTPLTAAGRVNSLTGVPCTSGIACVQGTNITNLAMLFVNDPGTPNGGIYARFGSILQRLGMNPVTPGGQSTSSTGIKVNGATVGIGLGYSLMSDFPETLNPFSLANSLLATILPTNLLGGVTLGGASSTDIATNLGLLATVGTPSTTYSTLVPNDLPLLEPLRLPSRIINFVLGKLGVQARLGTPLANALQPALSILVNTGYTDVVLPGQGGIYNRAYNDQGTYTQFMTKRILTPQQWLQVPGDVVRALIVGFQDQFPILRFGRPAPTLVPDGDHLAISYAPGAPIAATAPTATQAVASTTPPKTAVTTRSAAKPVAAAPVTKPIKPTPQPAANVVDNGTNSSAPAGSNDPKPQQGKTTPKTKKGPGGKSNPSKSNPSKATAAKPAD
ncbi:PE-PPE domain-containing protein [Mycolicibacterium sp. CBMA 234]|uniref:PE-PPE domain-containing protein n=1 Tax=Mycolicibacterium sp. CBMA 234 TaxID=1918495 RepID=UPI0013911B8A|nr:PE-PPE domain-containing protein [Mycolicibacterium sp. CBMA 234]